jgi:hypothetical protein
MLPQHDDFEELGRKAGRAERAVRTLRGVGIADGIEVVVDAENRLLSVTVDDEDSILRAYQAALADKQPALDAAMREISTDSRFLAVSTFIEAGFARDEAERARHQEDSDEDDRYYEDRNRHGWF